MRLERASVIVGLVGSWIAGCGLAHEVGLGDAGSPNYDVGLRSDAAVERCGATTCTAGEVCCNASCGICAAPGVACTAVVCGDADAGPPVRFCGGIVGATCLASEYCDYPFDSSCGGGDQQGICRPRPTECPDPGGDLVCGCDGHTYYGDCAAHFAGTSITRLQRCVHPTPARRSVMAQATCGPADGPAWTFTIINTGPMCPPFATTNAVLSLSVWQELDGVASGTVFTIGSSPASRGEATYCPAGTGGPPCFVLTGTFTLESFHSSASAQFSYDLVDSAGSHYTWRQSGVDAWCPGARLCG